MLPSTPGTGRRSGWFLLPPTIPGRGPQWSVAVAGWTFTGAPMSRTWVKLAVAAHKGDGAVTLAETVQGWRAGDRVIITDTQGVPSSQRKPPHGLAFIAEERNIRTIDGTQLALTTPLNREHR